MSLADLTRRVLAAGAAVGPDAATEYLLSVDPKESSLSLQQWKEGTLVDDKLLVDSVRPHSTAAYIITPTGELVIAVTSSSKLSAYTYDDDEGEWVLSNDSPISTYSIHPNGKIAAAKDAKGQNFIFFQNPTGQLICLDEAFKSTTLPVNAVIGTPIYILVAETGLEVLYISASDNFIHSSFQGPDGTWEDEVAIKHEFKEDTKAFCLGDQEIFLLNGGNELLKISAGGAKPLKLGTVQDGKFVAATSEQASITIEYYKNGKLYKKVTTEGNHVSYRWRE